MYLFYPSHFAAHKAHLDAVRVGGRSGQDIAYDAVCQPARLLVLLEYNGDTHTASNIFALLSVHYEAFGS